MSQSVQYLMLRKNHSKIFFFLAFIGLMMLTSQTSIAQEKDGYIEIVRNGTNKPGIVEHRKYIKVRLKDGRKVKGYVNEIRPKTLELSSASIPYQSISSIDLNRKGKRVVKHIGMYTALGGIHLTLASGAPDLFVLMIAATPVVIGTVIMVMSSAIPSKYAMNRGWYLKVHPDKIDSEIVEEEEE